MFPTGIIKTDEEHLHLFTDVSKELPNEVLNTLVMLDSKHIVFGIFQYNNGNWWASPNGGLKLNVTHYLDLKRLKLK